MKMEKRIKILCIFTVFFAGVHFVNNNDSNNVNGVVYNINIEALASNEGGGNESGDIDDLCIGDGSLDCPTDPDFKYKYVTEINRLMFIDKTK